MNFVQKAMTPLFRRAAQRHLLYGKRRRALALFEMLNRWSGTPGDRFNLALARMNTRDYEAAMQILHDIRDLLPDQLFAGITYGQCLLLAKRFDEANAVYRELSEANPDNALLKGMLDLLADVKGRDRFASSLDLQMQASLLEEEKRYAEAYELLQKASGLTPDDAALHNNLGALKLRLKHPLKETLEEFAKAMQLSPDNDRYKRNYRRVWLRSPK